MSRTQPPTPAVSIAAGVQLPVPLRQVTLSEMGARSTAPEPAHRPHQPRRPRGLGAWGEDYACEFVAQLGMHIVERNWTCARGEIDIVALHADCLVAVEVKTRRDSSKGSALEAVTPRKLQSLRRLIGMWLEQDQRLLPFRSIRIDVVAITRPLHGSTTVNYVRGAQ